MITFSNEFLITKIYKLSGGYPTLVPGSFTGTSMGCRVFDGIKVGSDGNIDCTISIPFTSITTQIDAVQINFLNPSTAQIKTLYNDCQAYITQSTTPLVPPKNQLICSRKESNSDTPSILISDLAFDQLNTVFVDIKAHVKSVDFLTVDVLLLQKASDGNLHEMLKESNVNLDFSTYILTSSNLYLFIFLLKLYRVCTLILPSIFFDPKESISRFHQSISNHNRNWS